MGNKWIEAVRDSPGPPVETPDNSVRIVGAA
jgi:hypothetical protein